MHEQPTPAAPRQNGFLAALREHRIYGATVGSLVAAWTILQVAALGTKPGGPTHGYLKPHPDRDPLRGDSRSKDIVDSLAPKPRGKRS